MKHAYEMPADLMAECDKLRTGLRQSEDRFGMLFRASSNQMIITTRKEGRIIDLNDACAKLVGYKREELIGQLSEDHGLFVDPQDRGMLDEKLKNEGKAHNLKVRTRTRSGEIRTVLLWADPIVINNEPCLLSVSVDITAREREAEALRESEGKYRMVVENSLQGLAILQDGRFVFCNPAFSKMMGYSVEELLSVTSENMSALIHSGDRTAMLNRYLDRLAGRPVPPRYEYRGIRKDGTEVWMEAYASPIEYHGRPAVQSAYVDITERRKTEKALRESEEDLKNSTEYLNQIINCLGDPIFVKDEKHRFVVVNDALCTFSGKRREELLGNEPFKFLPPAVAASLEAASGIEALRIAQEYSEEIHLVLTDAVMPGISGSTLVSRLESLRPGIKALYVSGYTDTAIVHHGILDSSVAFLQKPFSAHGLAKKVREVLNS
jgi:PAS domain S-box-containing protein